MDVTWYLEITWRVVDTSVGKKMMIVDEVETEK
jgi:hypothetical protein